MPAYPRASATVDREPDDRVVWALPPNELEEVPELTIGGSLFLIAVGAILNFAVTATVAGIDIQVAGVILMVVGGIGLLFGVIQMVMAQNRRSPGDSGRPPGGPPPY